MILMGIILLIFILYLLWRVAVKNISRKLPTLKDKVMNFKKGVCNGCFNVVWRC